MKNFDHISLKISFFSKVFLLAILCSFIAENVLVSENLFGEEIELSDSEEEAEKEVEKSEKEKKEFLENNIQCVSLLKIQVMSNLNIKSEWALQACLEVITPPPESGAF